MTASDLPTLGGIPDNGAEGYRFTGYTVYDALVNWDFTHPDKIAGLTPGLATDWKVDDQDTHKWVFTLRKGVKFQDGTDFNADAVIFNIERSFNDKAPQFDTGLGAIIRASLSVVDHWQKIDDDHIAFWTKIPYSRFPYLMTRLLIASPTQFAKVGSWAKFMLEPIGTGPFKVTHVTPHVSIEMARNEDYWDKTRTPKLAKMILFPMPEDNDAACGLRLGPGWIGSRCRHLIRSRASKPPAFRSASRPIPMSGRGSSASPAPRPLRTRMFGSRPIMRSIARGS